MNHVARSLCSCVVIGAASLALGADWPQWRGANRDGVSPETGLLKQWPQDGPNKLWTAPGLGAGYASVAVTNGVIYTTGAVGGTGMLFALDLQGRIKWKKPYGPEWQRNYQSTRTTPTVVDGRLYVMSGKGLLACHDAATGAQKWAVDTMDMHQGRQINWGIAESPLVVGATVIATPGGTGACVAAFDRMTGRPAWKTTGITDKSAYCSPILWRQGDARVVVTMVQKHILGIDPKTGSLLWRHPHHTRYDVHAVSPVYADNRLYCTSGYGTGGVMLELSDNGRRVAEQWRDKRLDTHHGGVVLVDGALYGTRHRRGLVCLDLRTGQVKYEGRRVGKGAIVYADGRLYVYTERGNVGLIEPTGSSFEMKGSMRISEGDGKHWAHPAIADGRLYIRHGDVLMCYDIKSR